MDTRLMTELALEMERSGGAIKEPKGGPLPRGIALARWDDSFADALVRLIQLADNPTDLAILETSRLRELYYAVLKGEAGESARRAFGVGNEIARTIEYMSSHLNETIIDVFEAIERRIWWGLFIGFGLLLMFHHQLLPWTQTLAATGSSLMIGLLIARLIGIALDGSVTKQWINVAIEIALPVPFVWWYFRTRF